MTIRTIVKTLLRSTAFHSVTIAGIVAGTLDIIAAFIRSGLRGVGPVRVLQSISSGLLGTASYTKGASSAILGLFLHFFIATTAALVYYAASRRLRSLLTRPLVWGPIYGVIVWLVMNLIVLPLSGFPHRLSFMPMNVATGLLIHIFFVGLPIALVMRRTAS
jgi:uncharacterized membrane protein YagU involved in acid resistance